MRAAVKGAAVAHLAVALALPAAVSANTTCEQAIAAPQYRQVGNTVYVYEDFGQAGMTGTAAVAAGVCVDNLPTQPHLHGGSVEAGVGDPGEVYVIWDGDDANYLNTGVANGYWGVSSYETGTKDPDCARTEEGTGSNSGGCVYYDSETPPLPVPLVVCGNYSGPRFEYTGRDGCDLSSAMPYFPW